MKYRVSLAKFLCNFKIIFSFQCLHLPKDTNRINFIFVTLHKPKSRQPCNQTTDTYYTYAPALIHQRTKIFYKNAVKYKIIFILHFYVHSFFLFRFILFFLQPHFLSARLFSWVNELRNNT